MGEGGGEAESLHTVSVCVLRRLESWCMLELHGNANGEGSRVLGGNAGKVKAPAEERGEKKDCMSAIVIVICQATGGEGKVDEKEQRFGNNEIDEGKGGVWERAIPSWRDADGDEGLAGVARPLRRKDKTPEIPCVERREEGGGERQSGGKHEEKEVMRAGGWTAHWKRSWARER